jgi:hypothetical protein
MRTSTFAPVPASFGSPATHPFRIALTVFRVFLATLMVWATFAQLATYEVYWRQIGLTDLPLRTGNFFSAFTFEVNLLGAVVLLVGAALLWRTDEEPLWLTRVRLCLVAALVITGVVYNLLLRAAPVGPGERLDWANNVVHVLAPLGLTIDWLIAPHGKRLPLRNALLVTVYPLTWLAYTFLRGAVVRDELAGTPYTYPYPFLNPHGPGGWGAVFVMMGVLLAFFLAVGALSVLAVRIEDRVARVRQHPRAV